MRNGIFSSFFYSFVRCDVVFFFVGLEEFFLCFNDCKLVLIHIFPLFGGAEPRTVLHWIALFFALDCFVLCIGLLCSLHRVALFFASGCFVFWIGLLWYLNCGNCFLCIVIHECDRECLLMTICSDISWDVTLKSIDSLRFALYLRFIPYKRLKRFTKCCFSIEKALPLHRYIKVCEIP